MTYVETTKGMSIRHDEIRATRSAKGLDRGFIYRCLEAQILSQGPLVLLGKSDIG